MRTTSFIHATAKGKDMIVSFALDVPDDVYRESLTFQRTRLYEAFLPPEERGVVFNAEGDENRMLAEVRWSDGTVALTDRGGWQIEIDHRQTQQAEIDRAMAVFEQMNFDGSLRISGGTAPVAARQQLMLEALASDDPDVVRYSLADAQNARELLTDPLLDLLGRLTPDIAKAGNIPALAIYLLAAWRETRALEPLIAYFEKGDAADEALGDIVVQDLPSILGSIAGGRFERIRQLIENPAANEWVRAMSLHALVGGVARGELEAAGVEACFEELLTSRLERTEGVLWTELAFAVAELASERLLPHLERAFAEGLVDDSVIRLNDVRRKVEGGRDRAFADLREERISCLIDDAVEATAWWDFFNSDLLDAEATGPTLNRVNSHDCEDDPLDYESFVPYPFYEPVQQVIRTTPKTGRNDPCPCGSGKKYKKCCGG